MGLMGDALSRRVAGRNHWLSDVKLFPDGNESGRFTAGLAVALLAGLATRLTSEQREDASFAAFYLISLALGVLVVSTRGQQRGSIASSFGTILAVDDALAAAGGRHCQPGFVDTGVWIYRPPRS